MSKRQLQVAGIDLEGVFTLRSLDDTTASPRRGLAVVGIGTTPAVAFLNGSGISVRNGIVVNERFETNVPDIYAAGDVACFFDPVAGRRRRIEHWQRPLSRHVGRIPRRRRRRLQPRCHLLHRIVRSDPEGVR